MKTIHIKSPAKINLHLQVVKKRIDGFHDIRSVFQLIELYDLISIDILEKKIILLDEKPTIEENIVMKAALKLQEITKTNLGARISLKKNIPMQRGLGGGSSDAASTLVGLNYLWGTELLEKDLCKIGSEIGSDIPIFIKGNSCWGEGKGDLLTTINLAKKVFLIALPNFGISTKIAFQNIKVNNDLKYTYEDFLKGKRINDFEDWARKSSDEINKAFDILSDYGNPMLTGTGSAVFIEFSNIEEGKKVLRKVEKELRVILVNSLESSSLKALLS